MLEWVAANETMLSGLAALVVIIGVTLSPMGAGIRATMSFRAKKGLDDDTDAIAANAPAAQSKSTSDRAKNKPSIAVLPFENLGGDQEQQYFADGIAEDIIVALSKLPSLFVIARNTSFAFRESGSSGVNLGRELGARYIVHGSVRMSGQRARITARIVDTETDEQLWAEQYDRDLDDILLVQDEITGKIISVLPSRIEAADLKRSRNKPIKNLAAYEFLLRGKYHHHLRTSSDNKISHDMFGQAIEADVNYAQAYAWRACVTAQALIWGWSTKDYDANISEIIADAQKALALDNDDFECHRVLSGVYTASSEFDRAMFHAERAYELNPNDPRVISQFGELLTLTGNPEAGMDKLQKALEVDPYNPDDRLTHLGFAQFVARRYEQAIETFSHISHVESRHHAYLAGCFAQLGEKSGIKKHVAEVHRLEPDFSAGQFVNNLQYENDSDIEHHIVALNKAGL
jgi:adenylate cyclase